MLSQEPVVGLFELGHVISGGVLSSCRAQAQCSGTGGSRRSHWRGPTSASAKKSEQISELGGSGGMPPGKFFF